MLVLPLSTLFYGPYTGGSLIEMMTGSLFSTLHAEFKFEADFICFAVQYNYIKLMLCQLV